VTIWASGGIAATLSPSVGPFAGGNAVLVTNCVPNIGNGSDITNVVVGGEVATTSGQGSNWVVITMPAADSAGLKDIAIESASAGQTTLVGVYTVNPAGEIGGAWEDWTRWQEVAGLPAGRSSSGAGVLNGALYSVGGWNSTSAANVYRFDGTNWTEVAALPSARDSMGVGVLNGALYAVGGVGGSSYKTNVYRYDGVNWTEVAGLPAARGQLAAAVMDGSLYAVAGYGPASVRTNVYRYDGTNWTEVAGLPAPRYLLAADVLNGSLYALGGENPIGIANIRSNVYRYTGTTWSEVAGLPAGRRYFGAGVMRGALYAVGGDQSGGGVQTNVYRYNGTNWVEVAGLPVARDNLAVGVLNDVLYAVGGALSGVRTNVYRYPAAGLGGPGVSPSSGSTTGGYEVVISGSNLGNGGDITNVTLCGAAATIQPGQSSTQVVVVAGVGSAGLGDVVVYSVSYGATVKSNAFTYSGPGITVLGVNGLPVANGEAADGGKGTDFGYQMVGASVTNTLSITNDGGTTLTISGWVTNGAGASAFGVAGIPATLAAGAKQAFTVCYVPTQAGTHDASLLIVNDATNYTVNLHGLANALSANSGPYAGGNSVTINSGTLGNGFDITNVLVGGVAAAVTDQGVNWVVITMPAADSAGLKDIVIESASAGQTTLVGVYTVNPAGEIGSTEDWTKWGEVLGLSTGRYGHGVGVLNGMMYVVGGHWTNVPVTNVYRYNGTTWTEVEGLPLARGALGVGVLNDRLYAVGGTDVSSTYRTNVYRYDGTNWMEVAGLPAPRAFQGVGVLDDVLYSVGGGVSDVGTKTNVYQYPAALPPDSGISLGSGSVMGGYEIVITGHNLGNGSDITNVTLCGAGVSSIVSQSATQVVVVAGWAVSGGLGDVRVFSTSFGETAKSNAFTYLREDQTITFPQIPAQRVTSVLELAATASSGLPVSFAVLSGQAELADGTNVTFTDVGLVSIRASQGGSAIWNAVAVTNTFRVGLGMLWTDYDGDQVSDMAVYRSANGDWFIRTMQGSVLCWLTNFGKAQIVPVPGDYDGDGKAEMAIYDPARGNWYARELSGEVLMWRTNWGFSGAVPVPGDYDGDRVFDLVVYDTETGNWYGRKMTGEILMMGTNWGYIGATPVAGDYDGDGTSDLAVYDSSSGNWYARTVAGQVIIVGANWGYPGTRAVPGDYDGDGDDDLAVYDEELGNWYIRSLDGVVLLGGANWGFRGARPVPGDYDGDGLFDMAVYSAGTWHIRCVDGKVLSVNDNWGSPWIIPVDGDYIDIHMRIW